MVNIDKIYTKHKNYLYEMLFPRSCYGCGQKQTYLCDACIEKYTLPHSICIRCQDRIPAGKLKTECKKNLHLNRLFTCSNYQSKPLADLVHDLKYRRARELSNTLAALASHWLNENILPEDMNKIDVVVEVPMFKKMERERGFNHAALIAEAIAEAQSLSYQKGVLLKKSKTSSQVTTKNKKEREKNLVGVFKVADDADLVQKNVLLIDDVITTGSTLRECAKALRLAGAKEVWGLAIAKD